MKTHVRNVQSLRQDRAGNSCSQDKEARAVCPWARTRIPVDGPPAAATSTTPLVSWTGAVASHLASCSALSLLGPFSHNPQATFSNLSLGLCLTLMHEVSLKCPVPLNPTPMSSVEPARGAASPFSRHCPSDTPSYHPPRSSRLLAWLTAPTVFPSLPVALLPLKVNDPSPRRLCTPRLHKARPEGLAHTPVPESACTRLHPGVFEKRALVWPAHRSGDGEGHLHNGLF